MFEALIESLGGITPIRRVGTLAAADPAAIAIRGLDVAARLGDRVVVESGPPGQPDGGLCGGEIVALAEGQARAMIYGPTEGLSLGAKVWLMPEPEIRPGPGWLGAVVDAFGQPLSGEPRAPGPAPARLRAAPPPAHRRRALGGRLATGLAALDTLLPIARGQRLGLFAGSGVGKSTLLSRLARGMEAECVVLVLIGERGRELGAFLKDGLGEEGRARSVTVVATADESPLVKRRAAFTGMAVAEALRDQGRHVLLLMDSLTRFAEAHREIALTAGETPSLRAYPPSTAALISGLAERAGPGADGQGDITALFTVLVAGSDMEEPVADMTRGTLDGHVILDRAVAERGRFPAIDLRRSVSRALPEIATAQENGDIAAARAHLAAYEDALPMIQTGLYTPGMDAAIDAARAVFPALDALIGAESASVEASFALLRAALATEKA